MWEPLQKQSLALSLKTSAALLYAGEGRLFILRSLSIFKKENVLKSFDFRTFGGDKRDRTADLLNAIQALSPYKRVAPPLKGGGESAFGTQGHSLFRNYIRRVLDHQTVNIPNLYWGKILVSLKDCIVQTSGIFRRINRNRNIIFYPFRLKAISA